MVSKYFIVNHDSEDVVVIYVKVLFLTLKLNMFVNMMYKSLKVSTSQMIKKDNSVWSKFTLKNRKLQNTTTNTLNEYYKNIAWNGGLIHRWNP